MEAPRPDSQQVSQALMGEAADILEEAGEWVRLRLAHDGYEGFAPAAMVGIAGPAPTHTPVFPRTLVFPRPDIKSAPARPLFMGSPVAAASCDGRFLRLHEAHGGGYVMASHMRPLSSPMTDAAAVAEMFIHAPYLWGGRTVAGIDCSGLVQMALSMSGHEGIPRDSVPQAASIGAPLPVELAGGGNLRRGDLIFWKGHVAMMLDGERMIHANGHHMRVVAEPLRTAMQRIADQGGGPVTAIRRP